MIKKKPGRPPKENPATASYTVRFTQQQKELLERAAESRKWPAAQLIRDAAVQRAIDIINADGASRNALEKLSRQLAKHIVDPEYWLRAVDPDTWLNLTFHARSFPCPKKGTDDGLLVGVETLSDSELEQTEAALRTCATEFAARLREHLQSIRIQTSDQTSYSPVVDPDELETIKDKPE